MAIHSDTSSGLTKDEIKKILTNTFANQSKKDIESAGYDKTILGTIQCCVDSSLGQYKVKYQNGYLTAYSNDISLIYSNGTPVYVTIPENNFNNRLTISSIATNDSSAKTYTTFLEDAQRYEQYGPNLILIQPNQTEMSSYAGELALDGTVGEKEYYLYRREVPLGTGSNLITLNDKYINYLKESGSLWLGASFKTSLEDSRKTSGDYGLIIGVRFKKDVNGGETEDNIVTRTYVLNTFNMVGNPFEFTTSMSQYLISDIDSENIVDIDYIKTYVKGFPHSGTETRDTDIIVSSLVLYGANVLYDSNNDKYKIELLMPEGDTFEVNTSEDASLPITAILRVDGNPVTTNLEKRVQFWWAKKNINVDSIGNKKYNSYTGQYWECLNTRNAEQLVQAQNIDDLREDPTTTVVTDDDENNVVYFTWKPDTTGTTSIKKQKCKSRLNTFKVVAWYNNTIIEREFEIKNENGIYLLIESTGGTQFYGGNGYTNLVAGAFRDLSSSPDTPQPVTTGIKYTWTELIDERSKVLPPTNANDILNRNSDWDRTKDNENKTDEEVNTYLSTDDALYCLDRYEYYTNKATSYSDESNRESTTEERKEELKTLISICERRSKETVTFRFNKIKHSYTQGFSNVLHWYITGNANVPAVYTSTDKKNYTTAKIDIDNVVYNYYGTSGYDADVNNVLYQLSPSSITATATYAVSASDSNGEEVGYAEVRLVNDYMTSTRYSLKITNGEQVFVYNVAGYAPDSKRGSDNPRNIRPLFFKLYDNFATEGDGLIYDSENETSVDNQVSITTLQPKWRFYNNSNSLISTSYAGKPNCQALVDNPNVYELSNEAGFYYKLREMFNQNFIYQSNIELEVIYKEERVVVGTNFTFLKEGDLGTNGTGLNLDIYQPAYEAYRDGVLTQYDKVTEVDSLGNSKTYYYNPSQRHLSNIYIYATQHSPNNEKLVNLRFGQTGDGTHVTGANVTNLRGQWFNGSLSEDIDSDSQWEIMTASDQTIENSFWIHSEASTLTASSIELDMNYASETDGHWGYEPFERKKILPDTQKEVTVTANNIVKLKATHTIAEQNDTKRVDYTYYAIPYFYYNAPNMEPNIDITNRFTVVGGFDTVNYDSTGANPSYANQPFKFYLRDENGNDITSELSKPENASKVQIDWTCSKGFTKTSIKVENYSTLNETVQLYNKYITYDGKHYHCLYRHTKPTDNKPVITSAGVKYTSSKKIYKQDGVEVTESFDAANTPILEYWEETDDTDVTVCTLRPYSNYESLVSENLFNSWIAVQGTYRKASQQIYTFAAFIPIMVFCNRYGSEELNNWDGRSIKMDNELGYLIGNKVAAGKKEDDNSFTGITIGEVMYDQANKKNEVGLFGYGHYRQGDETAWGRTIFMDAKSGRTLLGPNGSAQIALDPNDGAWSRLAGWYINKDYLYKPKLSSGTDSLDINDFCQGTNSLNPPTNRQSIGLYCPQNGTTDDDDSKPFIWANGTKDRNGLDAKFYVTHGGKLYAQEAEIVGKISANEGRIGSLTTGIFINYEVPNDSGNNHYVLYNSAFRVQDKENGQSVNKVYMKGRIMAEEGQFGTVDEAATGADDKVCFISYNWFPWIYPNDNQDLDPILDMDAPQVPYVFYHKNFHIKRDDGTVFINGTLYAKKGRVGGWIIGDNYLKSVGYDGTSKGLKLSNDGELRGPNWYILPSGQTSFTGRNNVFQGKTFTTDSGATFGDGELRLLTGEKLYIGDTANLTANSGSFEFFTTGCKFHLGGGKAEFLSGEINCEKIGIGSTGSSGINGFTITQSSIQADDASNFNVTRTGNLTCKSITIDGQSLENYIKSIINGAYIRTKISASFKYPSGDYPAGTTQYVPLSAL